MAKIYAIKGQPGWYEASEIIPQASGPRIAIDEDGVPYLLFPPEEEEQD